jgi:hypothetical protein
LNINIADDSKVDPFGFNTEPNTNVSRSGSNAINNVPFDPFSDNNIFFSNYNVFTQPKNDMNGSQQETLSANNIFGIYKNHNQQIIFNHRSYIPTNNNMYQPIVKYIQITFQCL